MANVQLPKFETTFGDIDSANLKGLQDIVKGLLNSTIILTEELTYLLNNLDTRNVNEIDGDVLVTGTVTAGKIAAGAITAEKIDVNELSAISANLGHITAGLIEAVNIFGSYIATSQSFPRSEMSTTNHLFGAYSSENNFIKIQPDLFGQTTLIFKRDSYYAESYLSGGGSGYILSTPYGFGDIQLSAGDNLRLNASGVVMFQNWGKIYSVGNGESLSEALNNLSARITALGG